MRITTTSPSLTWNIGTSGNMRPLIVQKLPGRPSMSPKRRAIT